MAYVPVPKDLTKIKTKVIFNLTKRQLFCFSLGALAGVLITPITNTSYDVGIALALKGFAAAMLGGMGNPKGALVGGLLLGVIEALTAGYISSQYKDAAAFIIILLVLFIMPQGLFGSKHTERV